MRMVRLSSTGQINKILLDEAKSFTHAFHPSTWDVEAGRVQGQPGLQTEFLDSHGYTEKPVHPQKSSL